MHGGRQNLTSGEEPNAFRLANAAPPFGALISSLSKDTRYAFGSEYPAASHSIFSRVAPDFQPSQSHPFEPASWLIASDLSSPSFSAHDFLQSALFQRYEASRPSHLPVLGDSFNADAALAALDTVESGLRRQRDVSKREEDLARDELRKVLHLSAKKKEQLVRAADTVSANVSALGEAGRQAALALSADVSTLRTSASQLATLQDTRDLVSLLTTESSELDVVRVSRLLSKARNHCEDGSLAAVLSEDDFLVAREEIERCESELASSLDTWMRNSVDAGNNNIVKECAMAAEELNISASFIDSYISYIFRLDHTGPDDSNAALRGIEHMNSQDMLQKFRIAAWETVNSVGEMIPSISQSFNNSSKTMISLLRLLSERKVIPIADHTLHSLLSQDLSTTSLNNDRADEFLSTKPTRYATARDSVEILRSLSITENREETREKADSVALQRRQDLIVCVEVFKSMGKLRSDLLVQCSIPECNHSKIFQEQGMDPFICFARKWVPQLLRQEKAWVDQQLGAAFFDITRVEENAPRLAPRENSDAAAYHRYRSFYSQISSRYLQMTCNAIESTHESLCRIATVLNTVLSIESLSLKDFVASFTEAEQSPMHENSLLEHISESVLTAGRFQEQREVLTEGTASPKINTSMSSKYVIAEISGVLREMLDGLVICYLANAETILQAASHLLPISEADARAHDLWVSGVSPLTAYMQAVEVLLRSNQALSEFLLTLEFSDHVSQFSSPSLSPEDELAMYIPSRTRERLHRDLTTGLSDLGAEAQIGVRAAVTSVRARLFAMLSSKDAMQAYMSLNRDDSAVYSMNPKQGPSSLGMDVEPSPAFLNASAFVEQQLHSVLSNVHSGNREFVISELSVIAKETVLQHWCLCAGPLFIAGAFQLIADGRAMARVFQDHRQIASVIDCLPAVGQLYLESADDLWTCVESKSLSGVEARVLVQLLKKREDHHVDRVVKVCQSLGASLDEL